MVHVCTVQPDSGVGGRGVDLIACSRAPLNSARDRRSVFGEWSLQGFAGPGKKFRWGPCFSRESLFRPVLPAGFAGSGGESNPFKGKREYQW